jgi:hypothetical protein
MTDLVKTPLAGPNVDAMPCIQPNSAGDMVLALAGTSTQSTAIMATLVRLASTVPCHVVVGSNPTATTGNLYLPANAPEYFLIDSGQKIAGIKASSATDGQLFITPAMAAST